MFGPYDDEYEEEDERSYEDDYNDCIAGDDKEAWDNAISDAEDKWEP